MYGQGGEAHGRCQPSGPLGERLHDEGRERGQLVSAKPGAFARIDRAGGRHPARRPSSTSAAALRGWSIISSSRGLRMSPCSICRARHWRLPRLALECRAERVSWLVADATTWEPVKPYDIWHDRAAFHFLTDENDRAAYIERLTRGLKIGGHAIIATFALDGPEKCSGLPVARYDSASLGQTLGPAFQAGPHAAARARNALGLATRSSSSACFRREG